MHKAFAYQFRFLVVALSGLLLNSLAVWVVTQWLQIDYLYAVGADGVCSAVGHLCFGKGVGV